MNRRLILPLLALGLALTGCARNTTVATVEVPDGAAVPLVATPAGEPFQFPADAGGALLARTLEPAEPKRMLHEPSAAPKPFPGPSGLTVPPAPVVAGQALLPIVPPQAVVHDLKPHLVTDEAAFNPREELSLPQAVSFPVPNPARLAARDVNKPIPLPVLAKNTPDRATIEDPTSEASATAAMSTSTPQRTRPAPYGRIKIAETYQDRAVRLAVPPPEGTSPAAAATLRTPGK